MHILLQLQGISNLQLLTVTLTIYTYLIQLICQLFNNNVVTIATANNMAQHH